MASSEIAETSDINRSAKAHGCFSYARKNDVSLLLRMLGCSSQTLILVRSCLVFFWYFDETSKHFLDSPESYFTLAISLYKTQLTSLIVLVAISSNPSRNNS